MRRESAASLRGSSDIPELDPVITYLIIPRLIGPVTLHFWLPSEAQNLGHQ
jgi:hypothetical protein